MVKLIRLTPFERQVWAATFAATYAASELNKDRDRPFGEGLGASSLIEADVLSEVHK